VTGLDKSLNFAIYNCREVNKKLVINLTGWYNISRKFMTSFERVGAIPALSAYLR